MNNLWTTEQVAAHCGIAPSSVRKTMTRWGVQAAGRDLGRGGAHQYPADAVKAAKANAPGKGNRTPRKP